MKKTILLSTALILLTGVSANAQIIIQPTFIESAPAPVILESSYPQHIEKHHHYDWKYWEEKRREQEEHQDHDHR